MLQLDHLLPSRRLADRTTDAVRAPPRTLTALGRVRRIGIEIKFTGLTPGQAAETVAASANGVSHAVGEDEFRVEGGLLQALRLRVDRRLDDTREGTRPGMLATLGQAVAQAVVPVVELVTEPVPFQQLQQFNLAIDALRRAGARDTAAFGLASFGTHLNVEIATSDIDWLTRMTRAYGLAEMWLRQKLAPDFSRRATPFIVPWPLEYVDLVVAADYRPTLTDLIDDYLIYNPTANRDLDLLPLFHHLDPDRVRAAQAELGVLPREAFHFRLPNTRIAEDGWSPVFAWNLWVRVEELAEDEAKLQRLAELWQEHRRAWFVERDWPETVAGELGQATL